MATGLTNTHAFVGGLQLLSFRCENLNNQCRDGQENPFDGEPPPTNEDPPEDAAVFGLQLGFSDHLDIYIGAAAFWTSHFLFLPSTLRFLFSFLTSR